MRSNIMGPAMYITWRGFGVEIDKISENTDSLVLYISVPKSTVDAKGMRHVSGNPMAGGFLAKRIKDTLSDMGVKRLSVKYKIRDEIWDARKRVAAETAAKQELYRSQW